MTETQRLMWVQSMPACASMNDAMQKFSGILYETSNQHKNTSNARQMRDVSDTLEARSHQLPQREREREIHFLRMNHWLTLSMG